MIKPYYICRSRDGVHWLTDGNGVKRFESEEEAQQLLEDELWTEFMHVYKCVSDSDGNVVYYRHWETEGVDLNER